MMTKTEMVQYLKDNLSLVENRTDKKNGVEIWKALIASDTKNAKMFIYHLSINYNKVKSGWQSTKDDVILEYVLDACNEENPFFAPF